MWPFKPRRRMYSADEVDTIIESLKESIQARMAEVESGTLDIAKDELRKQAEDLKLKFEADHQARTSDLRGAYNAIVIKMEKFNLADVEGALRARMDRIHAHVEDSLRKFKEPKKRVKIPKKPIKKGRK